MNIDENNPTLLAQKSNILDNLDQIITQNKTAIYTLQNTEKPFLEAALLQNESIIRDTDPQLYEQIINGIYLKNQLSDEPDFSEEEQEVLLKIAALCPQESGRAVYRARSLFAIVKDTAFVDACNGVVALGRIESDDLKSRTADTGKTYSIEESSIRVYPNPVKEQLSIHYQIKMDTKVVLYNLYGQEVLTAGLDKETGQRTLDVSNFTNGMYLLRIYDKYDDVLWIQKVVISK